jgi:hypothetical protein
MASKMDSNLKPMADEYARNKALIADLNKKQKTLKETFEEAGIESLEGDLFRVVLSDIDDAWGPDWEAIAKKLNPSRQMIAANQKCTKKAHIRISVYARTGEGTDE